MRKLLLVSKEEERLEHLALKLSAAALLWDYHPALESSPNHPALSGQEFAPDLMALDEAGDIAVWAECGTVSMNKLAKLARRLRHARLIVFKESREEGAKLRKAVSEEIKKGDKIEIWCWPRQEFRRWVSALEESTHVVGEVLGRSLNLVINSQPFNVDLTRF